MADPTTLTLNVTSWNIYLGIAIFGFFSTIGAEIAKYVIERWIRKRLDKLTIQVNKDGIEVTTKKTLQPVGTRTIFSEENEEQGFLYDRRR